MKRLSLILVPCLLVVVLAGLFLHPISAHGAAAPLSTCGKGWSVVNSPNRKNYSNNYLYSTSAVSATDVWAVGLSFSQGKSIDHPLSEHWNGTVWSIVPVASPTVGELDDVAAISATDVWAVGSAGQGGFAHALIEHWNGMAWSVVPIPLPVGYSYLSGIAAISANDIWADGSSTIEHWNGSNWSIVPGPKNPRYYPVLGAITAISTSDVWAVGYDSSDLPLTEHWDGTNWSIVANAPLKPSKSADFLSVVAVSATDVWAVGLIVGGRNVYQTLIEHWNGTRWTIVPSPNQGSSDNFLNGVVPSQPPISGRLEPQVQVPSR